MVVSIEDSFVFDDSVPVVSGEDMLIEDFSVDGPPVENSFDKDLSEEIVFVVDSPVDDPVEVGFFEDVVGGES